MSSPACAEELAYVDELRADIFGGQDAQIVPRWGESQSESEDDLVAINSDRQEHDESNQQNDSQSKMVKPIQDAATTIEKELDGAKILQRTSSTLEQDLIAKLEGLAKDSSIVSEAMEEAGWIKSTKAERERLEKLIASNKALIASKKAQGLKILDLEKRLEDQLALESQTARARQTASVSKSLLIFALGRKPETLREAISNDFQEAAFDAEPYHTNAEFKPRILEWCADLKTETTHNDATSLELLHMLILAHEDPAKLTGDRLSAAIAQKVQEGDLNCHNTAFILGLVKLTLVRMLKNLPQWEEDHIIFGLRALQLLSYHYPEASFLDGKELRVLLLDCKSKLKRKQVKHVCLVHGLEDLLDQSFDQQTNIVREPLARHVYEIAQARGNEMPGLPSADFCLIADGGDLLLFTKPIMDSTIRILKDGTFRLETKGGVPTSWICIPNLLEEGKTWKHTIEMAQENWYAAHLLSTCERNWYEQ
jgi:hypothetical protein